MAKRWDCDAVIIVASRSQKSALKKVSGSERMVPVTIGGQSYELMQFDGVGLCYCGVSSSTQAKARIAKLAKIDKYFEYNKVILVNPNYTERQAKRSRVGVKDSWYFVDDKQVLLDVLQIDYDLLERRVKKIVDKIIPVPPPPQAIAHPRMAPLPGQIIAHDGGPIIVMRGGGAPPNFQEEANMFLQIMAGGDFRAPAPRRRSAPDQRVAQPATKKAKAVSQDDMECLCCADNQKDTILIPCGHLEMCGECANKVQVCPSCSKAIEKRQHVWL